MRYDTSCSYRTAPRYSHCSFYDVIGKIEKYERLGMDTPKGMVIDTDGKERTDTAQVLQYVQFVQCVRLLSCRAADVLCVWMNVFLSG